MTKNMPLVSIITVVFNGERYLEETIESVINQSYENIEYIVIDGNSTDRTVEILEQYDGKIDHWLSEPDDGIYDAMNKGISLCSGEIIKLINADDLLTPDSVETAVQAFLKFGEKGQELFITSNLDIINEEGVVVSAFTQKGFTKYFESFLHPAWYVPAAIYNKYGQYSLDYSISSDYEYFLRLQEGGVKMRVLEAPLAQYRVGGASSGYAGTKQVFRINCNYFGLIRATYVYALHAGGKLAGNIKRRAFR